MTLLNNNLICRCYLIKNYFIKTCDGGFHVDYFDKEKLLASNSFKEIAQKHETDELERIMKDLEQEKKRRTNVAKQSQERIRFIREYYKPTAPHVYKLDDSYLCDGFKEIAEMCTNSAIPTQNILSYIQRVSGSDDIFKLPIFTKDFCRDLLSEIENFQNSDMPKGRPNSMNNYGVSLEEMGLYERFLNPLRESYLSPICERLYPEMLKNGFLDSQKSFVVTYKMDADVDLDIHFDNSEVTCNISISTDFSDGELYFQGSGPDDYIPYEHELGWCIFHPGSKLHGSLPISSGKRHNVIIWMRSSSVRNEVCPMCQEKPHLLEVEGTGDGFTRD